MVQSGPMPPGEASITLFVSDLAVIMAAGGDA